jgi:Protein of unknown function (DUF3800)
VYFFYVDESGNTGADLDSAEQPVHWLLALAVTPRALRAVETGMLALALEQFPERARTADFEFHGNHIYTRRGDCRGWSGERAVALYEALLAIFRRHDCHLFIVGIDKARLKRRAQAGRYSPDHPYKLAFMYLVERIDAWLAGRQPGPHAPGEPCYGMLIADEQKEVDRQIIERFAFWRQRGTEYSTRRRDIRFLVDTVHYVPSQDSWLIQMADCLAYLFGRFQKVRREKGSDASRYTPAEAAVVRLWKENCRPRVVEYYLWPA